jgi:acid stress chaperone HdeB
MGNRQTKPVSAMPISKKLRLAAVAACVVLLAARAIPASAQVAIDLSVVTCGQYMGKDRDTQDVLAAWMSGYFNAAKDQSKVDLARFERNRKAVEVYCKKHKLETLMSAIQRNAY